MSKEGIHNENNNLKVNLINHHSEIYSELKEMVVKYLEKAKPLFENLEVRNPENIDTDKIAKEFGEMAISYYQDAIHFFEKKEYARALAALEYAEGWLDAGKRVGIFK